MAELDDLYAKSFAEENTPAPDPLLSTMERNSQPFEENIDPYGDYGQNPEGLTLPTPELDRYIYNFGGSLNAPPVAVNAPSDPSVINQDPNAIYDRQGRSEQKTEGFKIPNPLRFDVGGKKEISDQEKQRFAEQQAAKEDINRPRSDSELQALWQKYRNPESTPEEKANAEAILRANADYILKRRDQNRKDRAQAESVEGRFIREQEERRNRQINEDLKSLGLQPTEENYAAMNAVRSMGMTAHDLMRARTEFSKTGRGYEWSQMSLEDKIGHANLIRAKRVFGGVEGEGLKGLNYKNRDKEVSRVHMLNTLVENGIITPRELVAGRGLVTIKNGQPRVSVAEVDKIVYRKERELYDAAQYAKMQGLEAEAEKYQAEVQNLKTYRKYMSQKSEAFARIQEMGQIQVTDGISRQSLLITLDTWYKEREQILKIPDDKERQERLRKNDSRLKRWKVSDSDVSIYLQTRKGDVYDRSNLGE